MNLKYKKYLIIILLTALLFSGLFYFRNKVYYSTGNLNGQKSFEIVSGEGNAEVAEKLAKAGIISGKIYFYYYIKSQNLINRIMPGVYEFSVGVTIPEVAHIITNDEEQFVKITFPEGWTAQKMAARLTENGLLGEEFLKIVKDPGNFKKRYAYLSGEEIKTLEGYLFPDTYYFKKDISVENIVGRLLDNFDEKLSDEMRKNIANQEKTIAEIVIMASIAEREVQTAEDMKTVAGIFWKRIKIGQRLESDAPLSYILGDNEDSHGAKDLQFDSPYNTYRYAGLPPGPIGNPGLAALTAAIYPTESPYLFFLTATVDGTKKVIYSKTFAEHVVNKRKYGL